MCSVEMRFKSDFNPRPPWGGRPEQSAEIQKANQKFQSTPSVGRATDDHDVKLEHVTISIHALRGEGDLSYLASLGCIGISIHALRGEGDLSYLASLGCIGISIHALRGEGDLSYLASLGCIGISIHALRGEGDTHASKSLRFTETFQSTPSVGRATFNVVRVAVQFIISIHALRGEGDLSYLASLGCIGISIHALRGEGDLSYLASLGCIGISIHALRGEGDQQCFEL